MLKKSSLRHLVVALIGASIAYSLQAKTDFKQDILPIIQDRCVKCHSAPKEVNGKMQKPKAGLRLDAAWAMLKGSEDRLVLTPGNSGKSPLYEVVTLPTDDDKSMPPEGKGDPLNKEQKAKLKAWIDEGADFGGWEGSSEGKPADAPKTTTTKAPPKDRERDIFYKKLSEGVKPVPDDVLKKLSSTGAQAIVLTAGSPLLRVDFLTGVSKCEDSSIAALSPVKDNIAHLDLARTKITDAAFKSLTAMPRLTRLDLRKTAITDQGLASLTALKNLTYLNIYETGITDAGLAPLGKIKTLQQIYLYQTKVTEAGIKKLKTDLPKCEVVYGAEITAPEGKPATTGKGKKAK